MENIGKTIKNNIRQYAMLIALVVIMIFFQIATGGILLYPMNVTNLVLQNSYVLILAIGMTLCILTGAISTFLWALWLHLSALFPAVS